MKRDFCSMLNGRKPLIGVGSVYQIEQAKQALHLGADLVAKGRGLLIEPHWVEKAKNGEPIQTLFNKDNLYRHRC